MTPLISVKKQTQKEVILTKQNALKGRAKVPLISYGLENLEFSSVVDDWTVLRSLEAWLAGMLLELLATLNIGHRVRLL
jgi:hypothetical protein